MPLETEHEQVNSLLAMIITTTPGTVSAGIDQERGDILVHSPVQKIPKVMCKTSNNAMKLHSWKFLM